MLEFEYWTCFIFGRRKNMRSSPDSKCTITSFNVIDHQCIHKIQGIPCTHHHIHHPPLNPLHCSARAHPEREPGHALLEGADKQCDSVGKCKHCNVGKFGKWWFWILENTSLRETHNLFLQQQPGEFFRHSLNLTHVCNACNDYDVLCHCCLW